METGVMSYHTCVCEQQGTKVRGVSDVSFFLSVVWTFGFCMFWESRVSKMTFSNILKLVCKVYHDRTVGHRWDKMIDFESLDVASLCDFRYSE